MLTCYLDESGTDNNSPTAVVGGLLLNYAGFFWLHVEWNKALSRHNIAPPVHMREFTPHGRFASVDATARRALFSDLVHIINDHKIGSIGAVLTAEHYRIIFAGVSDMSMYAACFAQAVMTNDILAPKSGYDSAINYLLDDGNTYKKDISEGYPVLKLKGINIGELDFGNDDSNCALQAADMISWTVRRCLAGTLPCGFEPLADLFNQHHTEVPYKEEWMQGVADKLRERLLG